MLAHAAIIALVGAALYGSTLRNPLTSYDDVKWMDDAAVRNTIATMFDYDLVTDNPFASTYYLPLQSALFYGMVTAFDREPVAYRSLALGIHVVVALLLYLLLLRMGLGSAPAFLAGLFIVAHLGNTQSVTWVSASYSHALVTALVLSSLIAFHRHLQTGGLVAYGKAFVVFVAALLVRESAVIAPVLMLGFEVLAPPEATLGRRRVLPVWRESKGWRSLLKYVPFVVATVPIVLIALRKYQVGAVKTNWGGVSIGIHAVLRLLDFLSLMLVPKRVPHDLKLVLCAAVLLGAFFIVHRFARAPAFLLGLGWAILGTLPYTLSNFNPAVHVMRYLYPGLIGVALILALSISAAQRRRGRWKYAAWMLGGLVPLGHVLATWGAMK